MSQATRVDGQAAIPARPNEFGPGKGETGPSEPVDYAAADLADLATKFGC